MHLHATIRRPSQSPSRTQHNTTLQRGKKWILWTRKLLSGNRKSTFLLSGRAASGRSIIISYIYTYIRERPCVCRVSRFAFIFACVRLCVRVTTAASSHPVFVVVVWVHRSILSHRRIRIRMYVTWIYAQSRNVRELGTTKNVYAECFGACSLLIFVTR